MAKISCYVLFFTILKENPNSSEIPNFTLPMNPEVYY